MKTILLFLSLAIFLLLSALATCTTDITPNNQLLIDVLDSKGNPLKKGSRYFLIPPHYTMVGGGLVLANLSDPEPNTCATSVVQTHPVTDDGIAVYFTPKTPKRQNILTSSPVNINFYLDTYLCADKTVWKVDHYPNAAEHYTISTGAKLGNPLDVNSWFQIKHFDRLSYTLAFCPDGEKFTCYNIGGVLQSGYRRLVLSESPMVFQFKLNHGYGKAEA